MDANQITLLRNLDVKESVFTVKVRIIRVWRKRSNQNPNLIYSIEMIVLDEEGTRMHANCLSRFFDRFEEFLEQGSFLKISCPNLGRNNNAFKYINNPYSICIGMHTEIARCNDNFGTYYGFNFTSFKSIYERDVPLNATIDVIGAVVRVFETAKSVNQNGKESCRRTMEITDLEGYKLYVTLWGEYQHQFSNYLTENQHPRDIVIILQFGKLQWFGGKPYVNSSYDISRLFINSDIDDINSFKRRFFDSSQQISSSSSGRSTSSLFYSTSDEFLVHNEFKKVAELMEVDKVQSVIILGSIAHVEENMAWYYESCTRCTKKVTRKEKKSDETESSSNVEIQQVYSCSTDTCANHAISAVPRIRLAIRVQDDSGTVSLTLFDRDAKKILKKTTELVEKYSEGGYARPLPDEIYDLVDKIFAFKVDVTSYNLRNKYYVYGISKISDDPVIISELEKKFNLEQDDPALVNVMSIETPSQETDVGSHCAENITPLSSADKSVGKRTCDLGKAKNVKGDAMELKRTLCDVYDVDEADKGSSSKIRATPMSEGTEDGKFKLLIPKVEK